jgi:DNA ligase-1
MPRREFLQLATPLDVKKHRVGGHYLSEKLDGTRCFWDGGISRGVSTADVPWASIIDPKTGNKKAKIKPISTGLWSRYGNPIIAPDWWLNTLPACFLDGELTAGRGAFQLTRSICGGDTPDARFDKIRYAVYSAPCVGLLFQSGEIKNSNMHRTINFEVCQDFITSQLESFEGDFQFCAAGSFEEELEFLGRVFETQTKQCYLLPQELLPADDGSAHVRVAEFLDYVLEQGGEGLVLRDPGSEWSPKRHKGILKWKPYEDAEGIVVGFTSGRETDKGSKHLGKIGALILDYNGIRLELSGLTDVEREFQTSFMQSHAAAHPGTDMPADFQGKHFRTGQQVTFKFRELSDAGVPKEARYWRRRDVE